MIFFMALFGAALGGFATVILNATYKSGIKPFWIIPALGALLVGCAASINEQYGFFFIFGLFGLNIVLFLIRFIWEFLSNIKKTIEYEKRKNTSNIGIFLKFLFSFLAIAAALILFAFGPAAIFGIIFLGLIVSKLLPSTKGTFFKLQQILPTSKIRSLAMGLVEVEGHVVAKEQIESPLSKTSCIGYRYTIESVSRDSEGKKSYHFISTDEEHMPFEISDDTGSVTVIPEELTLVSFPVFYEDESSSRRKREYVLLDNQEMMLIGAAATKDNQVVIQKDITKNILAISPVTKVAQWNKNLPLINSLLTFTGVAALLIAIILSVPYTFDGQTLTLMFNQSPFLSWFLK